MAGNMPGKPILRVSQRTTPAPAATMITRMARTIGATVDGWVTSLLNENELPAEAGLGASVSQMMKKPATPGKLNRLTPEEEVKQLLVSATRLDDVWQFFLRRLRVGSDIEFLAFSVLDESGNGLRVPYVYPMPLEVSDFEVPIIALTDQENHLIQALYRRDTTFTPVADSLGPELSFCITAALKGKNRSDESGPVPDKLMNLFSIPFVAGNRAIGLLTLGFSDIDTFSQAKLSYVYTMRDQIAQLIWNLVLHERMEHHAQLDPLTGLMSHSTFQRVFDIEMEKALENQSPLTVMIIDINNIQQINALYGHDMGDRAIRHLASTVRRLIRGLDTVARYGGDDVALLLPESTPEKADEIADRFINGLKERPLEGLPDLSISIGIASFPNDSQEKNHLLKLSEQALHLAKFRGGKTGESCRISCREMDQINEKTVIEVFASHVAKKYHPGGSSPSLYQSLVRRLEHRVEDTVATTVDHLMLETIASLAGALEAKDRYTRGHSQAVANYAVALCHALQLPEDQVEHVRLAALLHDIGKIGIPEPILCKGGPLNEREWEIMKQHPVIGARQILAPVTALKPIIPMVEYHHENWDGTGYPAGLRGEEIPLGARIVSIVDAFHGLTSDRAYRKALSIHDAKRLLEEGSGTKWDPYLLEMFFRILRIASPKSGEAERNESMGPQAV
jgi:diguanylate cyclase (GGDEF)-like protein/putative nucleotidyltransferase with HDIG domain